MKITFITTVFNEEKIIEKLLESIAFQSKMPDEIIIVDGGSSDNTLSRISDFQSHASNKKIKSLIKVFIRKGNRSVGRNEAIKSASGDIIICTDAGCTLDKRWVENITRPFQDTGVDVVAGYYKPISENVFEYCLAAYTCVMSDRVKADDFLPSSRSVAFKKEAWKKVGGYPENLDTCEDLVFAKKLKKAGFCFIFEKDAIVYWPQRKNIKEAFLQFFYYAIGDGLAHYFRPQTPFLYLRYAMGFFLLISFFYYKNVLLLFFFLFLLLLYFAWTVWKNYRYVKKMKALYFLPLLQITSDIAVLSGTTFGFVKSVVKKT